MATKLINNYLLKHHALAINDPVIKKEVDLLHSRSVQGRGSIIYPLRGHNSTVINNVNHHEMFGYEIANWTSDCTMSWAEITDLKAQELWTQSRVLNRPVLLRWSGGIDSTLVLIALLKHAEQGDLDRLIVATTKAGVWESSHIYFNYLANKVKTIDFDVCIPSLTEETFKNYIHVSGSPCDQLMIGMIAMSEPAQKDPSWFNVPWRDLKKLSSYLQQCKVFYHDQSAVDYIIRILVDNIESLNTNIQTVHQFVWWLNFNFFSISQGAHEFTHWHADNDIKVSTWTAHTFPWFYDRRYQQWAMTNSSRPDIIFGKGDWKVPLKQYIYDWVRDPYYLVYKPKIGSHGRSSWQSPNRAWFAIIDNETIDISDYRCQQILNDSINDTRY
jgi:hypothetical protein